MAMELERLEGWEARVRRVAQLVGREQAALGAAASSFYRKLVIGDAYRPARRLRAPVTLFSARDNYVALGEDYGLREVCAGEVRAVQLPATHRSILTGDPAGAIADLLSQLAAQ